VKRKHLFAFQIFYWEAIAGIGEIMVGQPFDCAQGRSHPTAGIGGTKTVLEQSRAGA